MRGEYVKSEQEEVERAAWTDVGENCEKKLSGYLVRTLVKQKGFT